MHTHRSYLLATCVTLLSSVASADTLRPGDERGAIMHLDPGVWEIEAGALAVLTQETQGDASVTQLSTAFSLGLARFIKRDLSVGVTGIFAYDSRGDDNSALTLGGTVGASYHFSLGLGAFFRPGIAIGALFGKQELPTTMGTLEEADQFAFLTRVSLPIAYFVSQRIALQAGPQLDIQLGSYKRANGDSQSFNRTNGGFSIGVGYVF